jgi:N-acetyltransferase 10
VAIDEAAAIPLPIVKALLGDRLTFMSSTVNGYEGTGRALSLKLIKELRDRKARNIKSPSTVDTTEGRNAGNASSKKRGEAKRHEQRWEAAAAEAAAMENATGNSALVEIELATPIRYSQGDPVEMWLNKLLCLNW